MNGFFNGIIAVCGVVILVGIFDIIFNGLSLGTIAFIATNSMAVFISIAAKGGANGVVRH